VMVLQPLVENAVRFATAGGASPARVMLKAQRQGDRLALTVSNSFRSDDGDLSGQGWGHAIIRERLTANYCDDADFRIETENGQFVVHVELPYEPHLACERPA
jgi:LytS/YehU family sensor histidine kinase